jgi:hypothetical protein
LCETIQRTPENEEIYMLRETLETFHFSRFCSRCAAYVPFFLSAGGSHCALCDARLALSGLVDQVTVIGSLRRRSCRAAHLPHELAWRFTRSVEMLSAAMETAAALADRETDRTQVTWLRRGGRQLTDCAR